MIETYPSDLADRNGDSDSIGSTRALAKGVLDQAAKDLRRFRAACEPLGRELYRDAYSWVMSNDSSWPYSFVNICEALDLSTEFLRAELLEDAQSGWYSHSRLVARRISTSFRGSLTSLFRRGGLQGTEKRASAVEFLPLKPVPAGRTMQLRNS
jgi:hypothetical protein